MSLRRGLVMVAAAAGRDRPQRRRAVHVQLPVPGLRRAPLHRHRRPLHPGREPVSGDVGEQSWAPGTGPETGDANNQRVGEFAYAILQDPKDFALIRLDPGVAANPQMCHFGGPTGVNDDMPSSPVTLQHFGNGVGVGSVLPARTAFAIGVPDPDHVFAQGAAVPGDGSGIISANGRAVGVIVTVGVHSSSIGTGGVDAGIVGITRLSPQVARAQQVLGLALALQTAPPLS